MILFSIAILCYILSAKITKCMHIQHSWISGPNFLEDTTIDDLKRRNGALIDPNRNTPTKFHTIDDEYIPETFDARTQWPHCKSLGDIRDQGKCGSCWAFAATEAMSDRLCIATNGAVKFKFSPQDLVTCCSYCGDCGGGYMDKAWKYWVEQGIASGGDYNSSEGCKPYEKNMYDSGLTPECQNECINSNHLTLYSKDKHFGSSSYQVAADARQIQTEILKHGPVEAYMIVFADFYNYKSGVYTWTMGNNTGAHSVKILGWGTENGTPYWLAANSWGTTWGNLGGFFKISRGENHCKIEEYVFAGLPKVN